MDEKKLPVYGLTFEEYTALRNLYATLGVVDACINILEKRFHIIPNGWRDAKMIDKVMENLLFSVVQTCPADRRNALANELQHMHVQVRTGKPHKHYKLLNGVTYVNQAPLERVIEKAMSMDCFECTKCGREVLNCKLRTDIQQLYHYEFTKDWREGCPFADKVDLSWAKAE